MEHFHWTLGDIQKLTVPQYFTVIEVLNKIAKKKKKNKPKGKGK